MSSQMWKPTNQPTAPGVRPTEPERTPISAPSAPTATETSVSSAPRPVSASTADQATIGKSLVIKGEVTGSESLYIDGRVEGSINLAGNRVRRLYHRPQVQLLNGRTDRGGGRGRRSFLVQVRIAFI